MSEKTTSNALEQLLNAAGSLDDFDSARELIKKVVDSPSVYSFAEFLEVPIISSMQKEPQHEKYYNLLKLFAHGTYSDYISNETLLPELGPNAIMKLRHLSIISLSSKCRTIPYDTLSKELGVKNIRELEDLIIEAFYVDVIKGKLDQLNNQLEIEFAIGRDVTDQQVDEILSTLESWCKNCEIALKTIETQISNANNYKQKQIDIQNKIETEVSNLKKSIKIQSQEVESMGSSKDAKKALKLRGSKTSVAKGSAYK